MKAGSAGKLFGRLRRRFGLRGSSLLSHSDLPKPGTLAGVSEQQELIRLLGVADAARDRGEPAAAAKHYAQAVAIAPTRVDLRVQLGNMLKDSGELPDAEAAYRQALQQSPDDADIHLQLGHVLKLTGRRPAARAAYRQAVALDPEASAALRELAALGEAAAQGTIFHSNLRAGGVDALIGLSAEVAALRRRLDTLAEVLPDAMATLAFPVEAYDRFREVYDIPPPPPEVGSSTEITVLLPADREALDTLHAQLAALAAQRHRRWQLLAFGTDPQRRQLLLHAAVADPRIIWRDSQPDESGPAAELAAAMSAANDWVLLLAEGAVLHEQALAWLAAAISGTGAQAVVADESAARLVAGRIRYSDPVLRQVVDHDTLLEANPFGQTIAVARTALPTATAQAPSFAAARALLLLTLLVRPGAGGVGHIPYPLVRRAVAAADQDAAAHVWAVRAHLAASGFDRVAVEEPNPDDDRLRVTWVPTRPDAQIAVIVPTRDNAHELRRFVGSLFERAARPDALCVLIIDNGSQTPAAQQILTELNSRASVQVYRDATPFNWSRLNNSAAARTTAGALVFANDDMQMLSQDWDALLRGLLERDEIGAIGARLLYPDDTVQHAGILFGWRSSVIHDGLDAPATLPGPGGRWHTTRSVSAVTGAFLATRRSVFEAVGGFDEALPVGYNDVDYAMRLRRRGLRVLWTPRISLYHHESRTRGFDHLDALRAARNRAEQRQIEQRWGRAFLSDPSVNPFWHDATLPFRLIAAPPRDRVLNYISLCASHDPWQVEDMPKAGPTAVSEC